MQSKTQSNNNWQLLTKIKNMQKKKQINIIKFLVEYSVSERLEQNGCPILMKSIENAS